MCIKNVGDRELIEGDIYYRYSARSEKIKYPELKELLENAKEFERKNGWNIYKILLELDPRI